MLLISELLAFTATIGGEISGPGSEPPFLPQILKLLALTATIGREISGGRLTKRADTITCTFRNNRKSRIFYCFSKMNS